MAPPAMGRPYSQSTLLSTMSHPIARVRRPPVKAFLRATAWRISSRPMRPRVFQTYEAKSGDHQDADAGSKVPAIDRHNEDGAHRSEEQHRTSVGGRATSITSPGQERARQQQQGT